ncbi:MAG TPA: hypothetical protein VK966_04470 [Longimicrobiales bacterium]|nr:hypothetical protein [Longimicrobiales bacterium]
MIWLDVEQGSGEWEAARLGIPTASQYDRILTAKTLKDKRLKCIIVVCSRILHWLGCIKLRNAW